MPQSLNHPEYESVTTESLVDASSGNSYDVDTAAILAAAGYSSGDSFIIAVEELVDNVATNDNSFTPLGNDTKFARIDLRNIPSEATIQVRFVGRISSNSSTESATFRVNQGSSAADSPANTEISVTQTAFTNEAGPAMDAVTGSVAQFHIEAKSSGTNDAQVSNGFVQFEMVL